MSNQSSIDKWAKWAETHLDIDGLLKAARSGKPILDFPLHGTPPSEAISFTENRGPRIAYALDEAFHFYYPENLRLLEQEGAVMIPFSPLYDKGLPERIDAIYLGGGYPEMYGECLSKNESMREAIRQFGEEGGVIYAECGGMIYLAETLSLLTKERFEMVGLIKGHIQLNDRLNQLGYVEVIAAEDHPLLLVGERVRGHEFHYSSWESEPKTKRVYRVLQNGHERAEGFLYQNVLASYIHLHFGSNSSVAKRFVCFVEKRRFSNPATSVSTPAAGSEWTAPAVGVPTVVRGGLKISEQKM